MAVETIRFSENVETDKYLMTFSAGGKTCTPIRIMRDGKCFILDEEVTRDQMREVLLNITSAVTWFEEVLAKLEAEK